jgi:hypothetical protein
VKTPNFISMPKTWGDCFWVDQAFFYAALWEVVSEVHGRVVILLKLSHEAELVWREIKYIQMNDWESDQGLHKLVVSVESLLLRFQVKSTTVAVQVNKRWLRTGQTYQAVAEWAVGFRG